MQRMHTHESATVPPLGPAQTNEFIFVVSVNTDATVISGDVLGAGGVTTFTGLPQLLDVLERATGHTL
jgi:hypothetical protein